MEKEFCTYELAVKLKELEFDEECFGFYDHKGILKIKSNINIDLEIFKKKCEIIGKSFSKFPDNETDREKYEKENTKDIDYYLAPLWQQAFNWFREKYNYHYEIFLSNEPPYSKFHYRIMQIGKYFTLSYDDFEGTYEEARQACLLKLIELCKKKE